MVRVSTILPFRFPVCYFSGLYRCSRLPLDGAIRRPLQHPPRTSDFRLLTSHFQLLPSTSCLAMLPGSTALHGQKAQPPTLRNPAFAPSRARLEIVGADVRRRLPASTQAPSRIHAVGQASRLSLTSKGIGPGEGVQWVRRTNRYGELGLNLKTGATPVLRRQRHGQDCFRCSSVHSGSRSGSSSAARLKSSESSSANACASHFRASTRFPSWHS